MSLEQLPTETAILPDGAKITYVREGSGEVVLFLHGAMGDYRSWAPQWDAFTSKYDCISISCRFSYPNGNKMPAPDHSAFSDAEDAIALLNILGVEKAIVVGSSYGGFASLAMAAFHPERVVAIVAVEPPMMKYAEMFDDTSPTAAEFREKTIIPSRKAFEDGDNELGSVLLSGGIQNAGPQGLPAEQMQRRNQNMTAARRIALSSDEFPLIEPKRLAAIQAPVLIFTGRDTGPVFKAIISGVSRSMPQAKVEVVDNAGHSVAQKQAETFNRLSLGFLGENIA